MKAVVLVGGEGTRLRPLTYHVPKPLLPVGTSTILEQVLAHLAEHGVTDAVLSLGYKPEPFLRAFPDNVASGVRLTYATEPEPLDTAGAIAFAARHAGWQDETLVVVNGDIITDSDVTALLEMHQRSKAMASILLTPVEDPSRYGVVPTDADGRVIAFIEKPPRDEAPTNMINAGTYVLEPEVLAMVEPGRRVSIEREVFPAVVAKGACYAMPDPGYWVDAGTPATLLQVNCDLVNGVRTDVSHETTVLASSTSVLPADLDAENVVIGDDVVIGSGVVLRDCLIMDGAVLGDHVHVSNSIVAGRVGEGAELVDHCVVGREGVVAPGSIQHGVKTPAE
jgi:mannose-1-phosphate guanylyltransferase